MPKIFDAIHAAKELGMSRQTLARYLVKIGVKPVHIGTRVKYLLGPAQLDQIRKLKDA